MIVALLSLASSIRVNPNSRMLEDNFNRTVIFHGTNIVVKVPPFIPITSHFDADMSVSKEDLEYMNEWGFNFVRLGVMWEAVERQPGWYNTTYLEEMNKLVTFMGESGVYSLIDAHQDLFARRLCGEGVPNFYAVNLDHDCDYNAVSQLAQTAGMCVPMKDYNFTYDSNGNPLLADCLKRGFGVYYGTPEVASAFDKLYRNIDGYQDKFIEFWRNSINMFKDNPYALGYDPINEPLLADWYKNPGLWFPGQVDYYNLQTMYENFNTALRKLDQEKIVFFEPSPGDVEPYYGGLTFEAGFTQSPGGKEYQDRSFFNAHTYCCQADNTLCGGGEPPLSSYNLCKTFHDRRIKTRADDAKRMGVGLFITEFGACADTDACAQEISLATDACDQNLASWGYWGYKGFKDFTTSGDDSLEGLFTSEGGIQKTKLKALVRTYCQAYQGVPTKILFDRDTGSYTTNYNMEGRTDAPTVLYYNIDNYYANGYDLSVVSEKGEKAAVNETKKNYLEIKLPSQQDSVKILMTPKTSQNYQTVQIESDVYLMKIQNHFESGKFGDVYHNKPIATIYNQSDLTLRIRSETETICMITPNNHCSVESWDLIKTEVEFLNNGEVIRTIHTPAVHHHDLVFKNI